ncbi:dihydrolipoyllysine-residue acetyltransferase component of pyruvate dehydrogenase complex [Arthrobacter sp. Hiyo4]|nr:dihydrolipoyllysine-residue acetyltransferase component of pyruvate dehydrogenase complex [Arthrobacter sp. Hiyo4]
MSESVNLPALGESVTEGTVTRWLKQVGDRVEVDEPLLEVSTDKVDTEIPSPIAGIIEEILVAEDETAEVGAPLVRIGGGAAPKRQHRPRKPRRTGCRSPAAETPAAAAPAAADGESHDVTLPALGESVTEGTVTRWLKAVGDTVAVDEPLLEVSTDKVDTEIPSPVAGTLQEIRVNEDETAEVGAVLAVIGSGAAALQPPHRHQQQRRHLPPRLPHRHPQRHRHPKHPRQSMLRQHLPQQHRHLFQPRHRQPSLPPAANPAT